MQNFSHNYSPNVVVAVLVVVVAVFVVVVSVFVVDVVLVVVVMFTSIHSPRHPDTNYGKI